MKKIIGFSLVLMIILSMMGSIYATNSFNVTLQTDKTEYTINDIATVTVNLADMQVGNGINSFGAQLVYDKNCFEDVKVTGVNGWSGVVFNPESGVLITDANALKTENGSVLQISFKVKAAGSLTIKNIEASGGERDITPEEAKTEIKIGNGSQNPSSKPDDNPVSRPDSNPSSKPEGGDNNQGGNNNSGTTTPGGNNNQGSIPGGNTNNVNEIKSINIIETNSTNKAKIPQAGESDIIFYLIGGSIVVAVAFFVRIKMMK